MKMNPILFVMTMFHMAWSAVDEEDDEYVARVEVRKLHCDIPEFPDIQAYGPKAEGALQKLNCWMDDVEDWLVAHEKEEFLHEDHGVPAALQPSPLARVKRERKQKQDGVSTTSEDDDKMSGAAGTKSADGAGISDGSKGADGAEKESADAQTFEDDEQAFEDEDAFGNIFMSKKDKKQMKINDRHFANYKASQATFYSAIKKSVKHNSDVLREVTAVRKCVDRGSQAIFAIKRHIMQSNDPGSIKEDSD